MAYDALRAVINAYIKQNGVRAITGQILNGVLNAMVGALGEDGLVFRGRALPSTDPGTPDEDVAYLAGTAGTYTRFGGVSVGDHELALLVYDFDTATWSKETIINVGGDSPVFVAEYGSTSYQEVEDAVNHGKIVFAWMQNSDGLFLPLTSFDDENYEYYFSASFGDDRQYFALESDDTWTSGNGTYGLEKVSNRVTTLPETGSNTKYTAVQAVRTYIGLLSSLTTTDKTSIVTAINELVSGKQPLIDANNKLDYSLLSNTPVIPPAPGLLDTTLQTAQAVIANEPLSGSVKLHKISKTGSYNDLTNKPTIPSAPGTLDTTQTTAQSTSADESLSGNVKLHKVSKTGDYGDLLNKPTIPAAQVNSDWDAISGVAQILNKPTIPTVESMTALEVSDAVQTAWDAVMV